MFLDRKQDEIKDFLEHVFLPSVSGRHKFGVFCKIGWWKKQNRLEYFQILREFQAKQRLSSLIEAIFLVLNSKDKPPLCECGRKKKFLGLFKGYAETCGSQQCPILRRQILLRAKETWVKKYGVDNPRKVKSIVEKGNKTCMEKYGGVGFASPILRKKVRDVCLQKYGVENPVKLEEIKQKMRQTCLQRYGVDCSLKSPEVREKIKQTCLRRYGIESFFKSKEFQEQLKNRWKRDFGVDNPSQLHIKHFENYNLDFVLKHFVDKNGFFEIKKASEYFNVSYNVWRKNPEFAGKLPPTKREFGEHETEIAEYLKSLDPSLYIERNVRGILEIPNFELDIFLPDNKIAIEFDGLVWHSFGMSEVPAFNNYMFESELKYKHLEKTEQCEKQGIRLFHIFENEWILKQNIWKSILANVLGKNVRRIYARNCEIREVSSKETQDFLTENHLQGYIPAKIHLGLFLDNELVSLVSFGKPRFNKNYEWELFRFCNKLFTSVVGGFSKLFSYFVEHHKPKSVITYVDRRYGIGNVYEKTGFTFLKETEPDYFYFRKGTLELYHRIYFQKHKLPSKLEFFDSSLTETENMYLNGYRKIYDCGNLVYVWRGVIECQLKNI